MIATLIVAGSLNACDNGERERERAGDREEERVRKAERDAAMSAKVKSLQQQLEEEKATPHHGGAMPPLSSNPEIDAMLSAARASAVAKPRPPSKCTCKADDPLCDCL